MALLVRRKPKGEKTKWVWKQQLPLILMEIWPVAYFALFSYWPKFGIVMAFQDYRIGDPFIGPNARWVGLKWFKYIVKSPFFPRLVRNTLTISSLNLLLSFPLAIIIALLLNEIQNEKRRKIIANISIMPHFISTMIIVAIVYNLFSMNGGLVNQIILKLGGTEVNFLSSKKWFRPLYLGSGIWQNMGFSAVVYTAAIAGIDPAQYESATIDGSSRLKNMWYITLPNILPTIIILLIMRLGGLLSVGYQKIILMYSEATYEVADVLGTYSYRAGILNNKNSMSTAMGFMNSCCNLLLLTIFNKIAKKVSDTSLW